MVRPQEISYLLETLNSAYGFDFTEYAESSAFRRVLHFMSTNNIENVQDLGKLLIQNEEFFAGFVQQFTVNVTEMFRDPTFYISLKQNVIKKLASYPFIRIWVAGCSTGEEAYSIAIMLKEEGLLERSIIYATDLNPRVVYSAKNGVYDLSLLKNYSKNYQLAGGKGSLSDYYTVNYNAGLFSSSLKKHIHFSVHSLTGDKAFNEFQLILCRNVMIYFNQQLQNKVFNLFHESLCSFGYLALGNKESMLSSEKKNEFSEIDRRERIFKRNN